MNQLEISQAALALDAWLTSQNIPANMKAPVCLQWIAMELVAQGDTPKRFDDGLYLLSSLLREFAHQGMAVAKRHGVR